MYNVAVIGSGPCGASAALKLEELGVNFILIDKQSFPRNKTCGGVLPFKVVEEFELNPEAFERPLLGYRIFSRGGVEVETSFSGEGALVDRAKFDSYLISRLNKEPVRLRVRGVKAVKGGVEVLCEKKVKASLVIACDGANSIVRKSLNMDYPELATALQYSFRLDNREIERRIGNWFEVYYYFSRGYGWITPLKGILKVGIGGLGKEYNRELLDSFIVSPRVKEKLEGAELSGYEAHRIPMHGPMKTTVKNRVLLAGDAGGFVYPGTGEGIYYAMKSGRIAAEVSEISLKSDRFDDSFIEARYTEKLEASGLLSLRDIDFIDTVLKSPQAAERYVKKLAKLNSLY